MTYDNSYWDNVPMRNVGDLHRAGIFTVNDPAAPVDFGNGNVFTVEVGRETITYLWFICPNCKRRAYDLGLYNGELRCPVCVGAASKTELAKLRKQRKAGKKWLSRLKHYAPAS
jgi:hypothetical protein